jgi:hypothetical protein
MNRIIGIALFALAIWAGSELMNKGTDGAFGGLFGPSKPVVDAVAEQRSIPQRAGNKAQLAHDLAEQRRNRMLGE